MVMGIKKPTSGPVSPAFLAAYFTWPQASRLKSPQNRAKHVEKSCARQDIMRFYA
jgi:hypothetical protein